MSEIISNSSAGLAKSAQELCRKTWWAFLLGGIASVAFGVAAYMQPGVALLVLAMFFAAYLIADGVFSFISAVTHRDKQGWWLQMLYGLFSVVLGGYLLALPEVSMIALIYAVAFISIFFGFTQIGLGMKVRKEIKGEWILYLTVLMSVLFGMLILFRVEIGGLTIVYLIAFWAIAIGIMRIIFSFRARAFGRSETLL